MSVSMAGYVVPRIHPEGWPFIALFAAVTLLLGWLWAPLGWIGLAATVWCALFFRDPDRVTPAGAGLVISPADGVICFAGPSAPPPELGLKAETTVKISVFMSVFDVHINRSPLPGTVEAIAYVPGKFINASLDKASLDNERSGLRLRLTDGREVGVVQIAGLVARRIKCFVGQGAQVRTGERYGLIRFGSRVDLYLPAGTEPKVLVGQRSVAGETVFAELSAISGGDPA